MYIETKLVLHLIDKKTRFWAGQLLKNILA